MLRSVLRGGWPWLLAPLVSLFLLACSGADRPGIDVHDAAPEPDASDAGPIPHGDAGDAHAPEVDAGTDADDAAPPDDGDASDAGPDDAAIDADPSRDAQPDDAQSPDAADAGDASEPVDAAPDANPGDDDAGDAAASPDANDAAPPPPPDADGDGTPDALDCAPGDPRAWQVLPFAFRDADGDGHFVAAPGGASICAGALLPAGYATSTSAPFDCDDASPAAWQMLSGFADTDRDGVGAGPAVDVCTGASLPAGYATRDDDCAPSDAGAYQMLTYGFRDADRDGHTVVAPAGAQICSGASLPAGYSNTAGEVDCDDTRADAWMWVDGYADDDGDKVGAGGVQRFCTDGSIPAGFVWRDGDCAPADPQRWQELAYSFRDADGDGHTVASAGSICTGSGLPAGYNTVPLGDDCNDADASVWTPQWLYVDGDGDGVGEGKALSMCVSISPKGFATVNGDCAPGDASRYVLRVYSFRDADGDGRTVPSSGTVCSGAQLPAGYLATGSSFDCDDTNAQAWSLTTLYADADGDGVGADTVSVQCLGDTLPAGFSTERDDCAPSDPSRYYLATYAYVDRDGDGATVPESGSLCGDGSLAPPYFTNAARLDCDDTNAKLDHFGPGYVDLDGDGFGVGRATALCLGAALPAGFSKLGTDVDDANPAVGEDTSDDLDDWAY